MSDFNPGNTHFFEYPGSRAYFAICTGMCLMPVLFPLERYQPTKNYCANISSFQLHEVLMTVYQKAISAVKNCDACACTSA